MALIVAVLREKSALEAFAQYPGERRRLPCAVDAFFKVADELERWNRVRRWGGGRHPTPNPLLDVVRIASASGELQLLRSAIPLAGDYIAIHLPRDCPVDVPPRHAQLPWETIALDDQARGGPPEVLLRLGYAT